MQVNDVNKAHKLLKQRTDLIEHVHITNNYQVKQVVIEYEDSDDLTFTKPVTIPIPIIRQILEQQIKHVENELKLLGVDL